MAEPQILNVIDTDIIHDYIKRFAHNDNEAFDETLYDHLQTALVTPIKKDPSYFRVVEELPQDAPLWLKEKWTEATFHEFVPSTELDQKIKKVKNWILSALEKNAPWLAKTDDKGRPYKLLKMGSLEQVMNQVAKETKHESLAMRNTLIEQMYFDDEELSGDIHTIMVFPDGYRFVSLMTAEALDRESEKMGHCIGEGSYDRNLPINSYGCEYKFFSLRDRKNNPHITLEVQTNYNQIRQCKGKGNVSPKEKYYKYILALLDKTELSFGWVYDSYDGLIRIGDKLYNKGKIRDNFVYEGNLDLSQTTYFKFPRKMTVTGDLIVSSTILPNVPHDIDVHGSLIEKHQTYFDREQGEIFLEVERKKPHYNVTARRWYKQNSNDEHKKLHRSNGPAVIKYHTENNIPMITEIWYQSGMKHRIGKKPALIKRHAETGYMVYREFWKMGMKKNPNTQMEKRVLKPPAGFNPMTHFVGNDNDDSNKRDAS